MQPLPLILAAEGDPHADAVVSRLQERGVSSLRLNRAHLPKSGLAVSASCLTVGGHDIRSVTSIWNRRLPRLILPKEMSPKWREWCEQEFTHALLGALIRVNVPWVSDPLSTRRASYKTFQLQLAANAGLPVPDYLITSDPRRAREFVQRTCQDRAVVKPLARPVVSDGESLSTIFTNIVDGGERWHWDDLVYAPCIFQRLVNKTAEVRVTVVGDEIFAAQIDVTGLSEVDYRKVDPYTLKHSIVTLPAWLQRGCLQMLRFYGLRFAAMDFLIDEGGNYLFLELNPNGQWLWIEEITGLPISRAIADELCRCP